MSVDIFFRLFNFILLFGAGVYFFIKKAVPAIKASMLEKKARKKQLQDEVAALKKNQNIVLEEQDEQQQLCQELKKKVDRWKESWYQSELHHQEAFALIEKDLIKKRQIQAHYFEIIDQFERIKESVVTNVEQELREIYTSKVEQQEYTQKAVDFLDRKL